MTIISVLVNQLCHRAEQLGYLAISSTKNNGIWGTSLPIIIEGNLDRNFATSTLNETWKAILRTCRYWIEDNIPIEYRWQQSWKLWEKHGLSVISVRGESISDVYKKTTIAKYSYPWTGINWQGESSSISKINAIAWNGMDIYRDRPGEDPDAEIAEIEPFYNELVDVLGHGFVQEGEYLSIPELVQRLIIQKPVFQRLKRELYLSPGVKVFPASLDRDRNDRKSWKGWLKGNGDRVNSFLLQSLAQAEDQTEYLTEFSRRINRWATDYLEPSLDPIQGSLIYGRGDDFLVCFQNSLELSAARYLQWIYEFNSATNESIWKQHQQPITLSSGWVWAAPKTSEQDVLHHCFAAEKSAKQQGGDRLALRILFSSGNYLEWVCPWWFLPRVLQGYRDRGGGKNWTHIYRDVAQLESRHGFDNEGKVALALFEIYFGQNNRKLLAEHLWNTEQKTGILGIPQTDDDGSSQSLTNWVIKLSKVGYHLCP
ncbi:Cas10/Cmr2 second palm domain-containing protein [Roseofilum casamattae]|uniref:Cas10/Cmr2 second palm domain-containing protein n=1 Tax=Roseofilum casamattae BLCC-M143 TaxID=3022442 RepID=A0ABT7BS14_9CYAN|nr:hypothetical protein [Roseofilum casamattae]MDJ1181977.1 hypothetical protein [Roseofilum casamattae BLCC-M143]